MASVGYKLSVVISEGNESFVFKRLKMGFRAHYLVAAGVGREGDSEWLLLLHLLLLHLLRR